MQSLSLPTPILQIVENISRPEALHELHAFYAPGGAASRFKVHLDDTCGMPSDWRATWDKPRQWGLTGEKNWATKYGAAGFIPRMIDISPYATSDWRSASASVVILFARQFAGGPAIAQQQCLQRLRERSPSFRATNGSRHFFIFTDSRGPCCLDGKYKDVGFLDHHVIGPHGEPVSPGRSAAASAPATPGDGFTALPSIQALNPTSYLHFSSISFHLSSHLVLPAPLCSTTTGSSAVARALASAVLILARTSIFQRQTSTSRARPTRLPSSPSLPALSARSCSFTLDGITECAWSLSRSTRRIRRCAISSLLHPPPSSFLRP